MPTANTMIASKRSAAALSVRAFHADIRKSQTADTLMGQVFTHERVGCFSFS